MPRIRQYEEKYAREDFCKAIAHAQVDAGVRTAKEMAQAVEMITAAGGVAPVFVSANLEGGDEHNKKMLSQYKDHIFYMGEI